MKIIDPHIHLFDLDKGEYHWLKPENPPFWPDKRTIYRNFSEHDLLLKAPFKIDAFVHIEAGFNNERPDMELAWLKLNSTRYKAVAFADLTLASVEFEQVIQTLKTDDHIIGIRHILDKQACSLLTNRQVVNNLCYLSREALLFECQLELTDNNAIDLLVNLLDQLPSLTCILNHAGFPPLGKLSDNNQLNIWLSNLKRLASFPTVAIKCSGFEMLKRDYSDAMILTVVSACIEAFGQPRVMMASNFPLTLFSTSYCEYWQRVIQILPKHSINSLCYENAKNWYKLGD